MKKLKIDVKRFLLIVNELMNDGLIRKVHDKSHGVNLLNEKIILTKNGKYVKEQLLYEKYSHKLYSQVLLYLRKNHEKKEVFIEDLIKILWNGSDIIIQTKRTQITTITNKLEDHGLIRKEAVKYCGLTEPRVRLSLTEEGLSLTDKLEYDGLNDDEIKVIKIFNSLKPKARKTFLKNLIGHSLQKI